MPDMQVIVKIIGRLLLVLIPFFASSQSAYLPQGNKHSQLLTRLEILLQNNPSLNLSTAKPLLRKMIVETIENDSLISLGALSLSVVDRYNLNSLLMNNAEWVTGDRSDFASKKPIGKTFYKTPANFFEVKEKDFFLAINPIVQFQLSKEMGNDQRIFLNSRGISIRGVIARRLGFYTQLVENLERSPLFMQDRILQTRAVPGAGRYNSYKLSGVDYSDARGGFTFNAAKYLDFQFAYDKNFIGNGYRSLILSEESANYLFLKVNTRIWKFNYQNIFMELNPQFSGYVRGADLLLDKKYAAMHHLSMNVTPWLNIGLFEAVIFGRKNHFDFSYLNPVIFLRTAEKQNNSPDNGLVGFDFKANLAKRGQLYGQLMFDELKIKELFSGDGWFGNKFGIQLGGKYINLFNIPNLDIQGELNLVRPFTYSHYDSTASYGHYNQPLAHPLGANFIEGIGIVRYQPLPRLTTAARFIFWNQGADTLSANYGGNIFKLYTTRSAGDYGYTLPSGVKATGVNIQLLASYEIRENLFIDGAYLLRNWKTTSGVIAAQDTKMFTAGIRMNVFRREYDY